YGFADEDVLMAVKACRTRSRHDEHGRPDAGHPGDVPGPPPVPPGATIAQVVDVAGLRHVGRRVRDDAGTHPAAAPTGRTGSIMFQPGTSCDARRASCPSALEASCSISTGPWPTTCGSTWTRGSATALPSA